MPSSRPEGPALESVIAVLEKVAPRPLTMREIAQRLGLDRYDRRAMDAALDGAVEARRLRRVGRTRYQWAQPVPTGRRVPAGPVRRRREDRDWFEPAPATAPPGRALREKPRSYAPLRRSESGIEGRYSRTRGGFGFVAPEGELRERYPRDVLIPEGREGAALHGDRVRIEVLERDVRTHRASGRIVEVLHRAHEHVVGVLEHAAPHAARPEPARRAGPRARFRPRREPEPSAPARRRWRVVPQSELLPVVDVVGGMEPSSFDAGKLALVRLLHDAPSSGGIAGEIERILGDPEDPEVQFLTIAIEHGLRIDFPPDAAAEAAALPSDPSPDDLVGREDLRTLPFVTIDGETARDFDDAVCLQTSPGGGRRLLVAIADVGHYVRPGSALDAEALARGTSVYFPDRAIPMLPPELSSELCSLRPDRDRLVLVADMQLDRRGERTSSRFYRAVLRSRARLTYTQVAAVLSETDTAAISEDRDRLAPLLPQLRHMRELMRVLHRRRIAAGSLDLDLPEAMVDLSAEGRSIGVRLSARNDAHRLIEEMMLEANRAVAEHLQGRGLPFPYRVHEPPDPADVDELNELLGAFGARVDYDGVVKPRDVQAALRALEGHAMARVLSRQVLRALKQAHYTTRNAGHFGLAFSTYCHFTSPIRRYPDLLVHRQLGAVFDGEANEEAARERGLALESASLTSSQRERDAMEAERAMLDLKKAEFMLDHLLEPEPATIVSVAKFGAFVELEAYPVEGLLRLDDLSERFAFDERARALVGASSGARLRLGDRVLVEATDVSLRRRQVGFKMLEHLGPPPGAPREDRPARPARRPRADARRPARR